jgi:hypothetical protein
MDALQPALLIQGGLAHKSSTQLVFALTLLVAILTLILEKHVMMETLLAEMDAVALVKLKHATGAVELEPVRALRLEQMAS